MFASTPIFAAILQGTTKASFTRNAITTILNKSGGSSHTRDEGKGVCGGITTLVDNGEPEVLDATSVSVFILEVTAEDECIPPRASTVYSLKFLFQWAAEFAKSLYGFTFEHFFPMDSFESDGNLWGWRPMSRMRYKYNSFRVDAKPICTAAASRARVNIHGFPSTIGSPIMSQTASIVCLVM